MQGPASFVIIQAQQIIIATNGISGNGLFVYDPSPGTGKLTASIVSTAGTDAFGNTTFQGITAYAPSNQTFTNLGVGGILFGSQASATRITNNGKILMGDAISDPSRPTMEVITPIAGAGLNGMFVVAFGESHDTLHPAQLLIRPTTSAGSLVPTTTATLEVTGDIQAINSNIIATGLGIVEGSGGLNAGIGNLSIPQPGAGIKVAEGTNAKQGTATLVAGAVTVANTAVLANSRIFLTTQTPGGTPGALFINSRIAGTSFTVHSTSATDTSTFAYEIFDQ